MISTLISSAVSIDAGLQARSRTPKFLSGFWLRVSLIAIDSLTAGDEECHLCLRFYFGNWNMFCLFWCRLLTESI